MFLEQRNRYLFKQPLLYLALHCKQRPSSNNRLLLQYIRLFFGEVEARRSCWVLRMVPGFNGGRRFSHKRFYALIHWVNVSCTIFRCLLNFKSPFKVGCNIALSFCLGKCLVIYIFCVCVGVFFLDTHTHTHTHTQYTIFLN